MKYSMILLKKYHPHCDNGKAIRKATQILLSDRQLSGLWKAGQRKKESAHAIRVKAFIVSILEAADMTISQYRYEVGLYKMPRQVDECHDGSCCDVPRTHCFDCSQLYDVRPHPFHSHIRFGEEWDAYEGKEPRTDKQKIEDMLKSAAKIQGIFGVDLHLKPDFTSLETVVDTIIEKLSIFSTDIDWKHIVISFLLCIATVWFNFDRPTTILMAISQFVMNLKLRDDLLKGAIDFFCMLFSKAQEAIGTIIAKCSAWCLKYTSGVPGVKVQAGLELPFPIDVSPLLPIIGTVFTSLFALVMLQQLPGGDKFQTNFDRFAKLSGVIRTFKDLQKIGADFFEYLWDSIAYYVFGVEKPVMDEWRNINLWIAEVNVLITPDFESNIRNNEQLKNTVETLIQRGLNILRILDMLKIPMSERQAIQACMMFLYRARETAASCGAGQTKPRVAPAIIHFYGDSGVGKSTTLWAIIAEIQAALGVTKASDLHEKTYFRRPGGEFWDGYSNGMNVVVCDDFGAIKDNAQKPNEEFLEAIHMSNTAFWQLNMADLKDKGNTFFQAKCVLWTSNKSHFAVTSLTNPEAVIRRVDLKIRQRPHPKFAMTDTQGGFQVNKLDERKVNEAIQRHGKKAMLGCVLFDIIDKNDPNDKVLEQNLSFWDVAARCTELVKRNINYFEDFNDVLSGHVEDAIERCKDGAWKPSTDVFNPDTFTPRVQGFGDSIRGLVSSVQSTVGHVSVHSSKYDYSDCLPIVVTPGEIDQDNEYRLLNLAGMSEDACFRMASEDVKDFMSCFQAATLEMHKDYYEYDLTDVMFANLFHQGEKQYGKTFKFERIACCESQPEESVFPNRLRQICKSAKVRLDHCIQKTFGMNPSTFFLVVSTGTVLLTVLGYTLYKTIFSRVESMTFESYDAGSKTKGKKSKTIAEGIYSKEQQAIKLKKIVETSSYDANGARARTFNKAVAESSRKWYPKDAFPYVPESAYDQNAKGKKTNKVFESIYSKEDAGRSKGKIIEGQPDDRNFLERTCDFFATMVPTGPYGKPKCQHGNVQGLCFYCSPQEQGIKAQAIVDQNAAEVVNCVYKNMYKLEYFTGTRWQHAMNLLVVKGRLAIVNRHLQIYDMFSRWRIRNQNFADGIEFDLANCQSFYAPDDNTTPYGFRDIMMIELPMLVHQHKDITAKFMDGNDFARFSQLHQVSVIGYIPNDNISVRQYFGSDVEADDSVFPLEYPDSEKVAVTVRSLIKYNIQTSPGDCGAVLVAFDKNFSNKIFGIHCAGIGGSRFQGFGTPTSRGHLAYLEKEIAMNHVSSVMSPELECINTPRDYSVSDENGVAIWTVPQKLQGNFYPIGKDTKAVFQPCDTRIIPSPVHGVIQTPTMAPAILRSTYVDGVLVDPMANARYKASPISPPLDKKILRECGYNVYQKIGSSNLDKKLLTYEQSIAGIAEDPCYPHMKRQTSPGYGWDKTGVGKTKWLGSEGEFDTTNVELRTRAEAIIAMCKQGKRPNTVWTDTLKDERRTLDKVKACKTRLFSCGEMAYTLVFRMYFSGFIAHMTRRKIDVESCVGTNVYSMDWNKIANTLKQVGNNILAGDFANYDGTLHPDILWEVCDLINNWYDDGPENRLVRVALWSEIVNSIHIVGDTFYMWNHSQPSGCPMTTILNCTYHSISARYVYILCARESAPLLAGLENFEKFVRHVNYGDDDVWSISSEIIDWFNQLTITDAYKKIGMTYTDEQKTGNIVSHRTLDEVDFLKRKFRWDAKQCRYRAPLALSTIKEMAMWNHGTVDQYPLTKSILEDAVRELAQHDEQVFIREIPAFERAAGILHPKVVPIFKTYDTYQYEEYVKIMEESN